MVFTLLTMFQDDNPQHWVPISPDSHSTVFSELTWTSPRIPGTHSEVNYSKLKACRQVRRLLVSFNIFSTTFCFNLYFYIFQSMQNKIIFGKLISIQETSVIVFANITSIMADDDWWYTSCICGKSVYPDSKMLFYEKCNKHVMKVVPSYVLI